MSASEGATPRGSPQGGEELEEAPRAEARSRDGRVLR